MLFKTCTLPKAHIQNCPKLYETADNDYGVGRLATFGDRYHIQELPTHRQDQDSGKRE